MGETLTPHSGKPLRAPGDPWSVFGGRLVDPCGNLWVLRYLQETSLPRPRIILTICSHTKSVAPKTSRNQTSKLRGVLRDWGELRAPLKGFLGSPCVALGLPLGLLGRPLGASGDHRLALESVLISSWGRLWELECPLETS